MKKKIYSIIISGFMMVLSTHISYSQGIICQTPEASINLAAENAFNQYVIKFKAQGKHLNTDLKIIPVVIHVIYRNSANSQQITMARIRGQIDATNKQLRRLNTNAKETRKYFYLLQPIAIHRFALLRKNPTEAVSMVSYTINILILI